jgi:arsenate reductase
MAAQKGSQKEQEGYQILAKLLAVLSHPTRLRVLETVSNESPVKGYIVDVNELSKNAVLNNLKLLKKFGFITGNFTTHDLFYSINYDKLDELKEQFEAFYDSITSNRPLMKTLKRNLMYTNLKQYVDELTSQFDQIPENRKEILQKLAQYILSKQEANKPVKLVYICTHNSRRSHFGQVWAQLAAHFYDIKNVTTYSGGTEATAFNVNAIEALKRAGFKVEQTDTTHNPPYLVYYDEKERPITCFSKVYDHPNNPQSEFGAIMTCSDAEENCPFIPGVELRVGTTYDDPKEYDNTPFQDTKYDERCKQIALETLYTFSLIH